MNINLDDNQYQEEVKSVFNGGNAGVARNLDVRIEKRAADANQNGPKYKLYFTDKNGGEVNRPLWELKDDASPGTVGFFVREMNHLQSQFGFKIEKAAGAPNEILDQVAQGVHNNSKGKKFGAAVGFGTINRPSTHLEVDGHWGYRNEENITEGSPLLLRPVIMQTRIEPTPNAGGMGDDGTGGNEAQGSGDLPF